MCSAEIHNNDFDSSEVGQLKLKVEELIGAEVKVYQTENSFNYFFVLPNNTSDKLFEAFNLINEETSQQNQNYCATVKLLVENEIIYYQIYEQLKQLCDKIEHLNENQIKPSEENPEVNFTKKFLNITHIQSVKGEIFKNNKNESEFSLVPTPVINHAKTQINSLENEIMQIENQEFPLDEINVLITKLRHLEEYITKSMKKLI